MALVCVAAAVIATLSWRPVTDPVTLAVGAVVIIGMGAFAVRTITGVDVAWSAAIFVHLAVTLALGPPGAIVAGIADGFLGRAIVTPGLLRGLFNAGTMVLANLGAWWAAHLVGTSIMPRGAPLAGLFAGATAWVVDFTLVSVVISIASQGGTPVRRSLPSGLAVLPHTIAAGWAAAGVALLYGQKGTIGFTMFLVPVLSAQAFLVLLARRSNAHLRELLGAQEHERRRIARDLHDTVVQVVVGNSMRLAAASTRIVKEVGQTAEKWSELLNTAGDDLRGAARDLRTLIIQIAPPSLEQEGLPSALNTLAVSLREVGVEVHFDFDEIAVTDKSDRELLFRVAQEAFRNVAQHSHASHLDVELRTSDTLITMNIIDDGIGFSPSDVDLRRSEGHVGTRGLEEVAAERGAVLTIDSKPGRGTRLYLAIPVTQGR
ncbi:MAG: sensor histidine kinase [Acidimicrobiales bacterium]